MKIKLHISYLRKDFLGELNFLASMIINGLYSFLTTHLMIIKLKWGGYPLVVG